VISFGTQWNFDTNSDKSIAYIEHEDFGPHVDPGMEMHFYVYDYDGQRKERQYDPMAFDS